MPKFTMTINPENEKKLRERNRHKGDISKIINEALDQYFKEDQEQKKKHE